VFSSAINHQSSASTSVYAFLLSETPFFDGDAVKDNMLISVTFNYDAHLQAILM
jgi:hypothetical protein